MLGAWWKADTLGLTNGQTVTTWPDSTNYGWTLTPVASPTLSTSKFAVGAVAFNGSTQYAQNTGFTGLNALAGFTMFVVYAQTSLVGANNWVVVAPTNKAGQMQILGGATYAYASNGNFGSSALDSITNHVREVVFDGSQSTNATRLIALHDGTAQTLSFTGTIPAATDIGSGISLGAITGAVAPFSGHIAEVLIYPSVVSSGNRSTIRQALGTKWTVTVAP